MRSFKKASLAANIAVVAVFIVLVSVSFYLGFNYLAATGERISKVPEISYNFPSAVLNSFLMMPVEQEDKDFFSEEGDYRVKDLIRVNTDSSLERVAYYRSQYLEELKELNENHDDFFSDFEKFSGVKFNVDEIIVLGEFNEFPSLRKEIEDGNFYYVIRSRDSKNVLVFFTHDQLSITDYVADLGDEV